MAWFRILFALFFLLVSAVPAQATRPDGEYVKDLSHKDSVVRRQAAAYLAVKLRRFDALIPNYIVLLNDPEQQIRDIAASALSRTERADVFDPIMNAFLAKKLTYHTAAAALLRFQDRAFPAMVRALDSPEELFRYAAIRFLVGTRSPKAAEILVEKLRTNPDYRSILTISLPSLGVAAVPSLIPVLLDPSLELANIAARILTRINDASAQEAVELYAARMLPKSLEDLKSNDRETRIAALKTLSSLEKRSAPAIPILHQLYEDERLDNRERALVMNARRAAGESLPLENAAPDATSDTR